MTERKGNKMWCKVRIDVDHEERVADSNLQFSQPLNSFGLCVSLVELEILLQRAIKKLDINPELKEYYLKLRAERLVDNQLEDTNLLETSH